MEAKVGHIALTNLQVLDSAPQSVLFQGLRVNSYDFRRLRLSVTLKKIQFVRLRDTFAQFIV